MNVLYHIPSLYSIYAQRTIYNGFKNAFEDLGHTFRPLTSDDDFRDTVESFRPDLFITASHFFYRKYLDFVELNKFRDAGLFVLVKIDFWQSPLSKLRINEAPQLSDDAKLIKMIKEGRYGDSYFHVVEQDDERMLGFEQQTDNKYVTIPLAADAIALGFQSDSKFTSDISYIGTNLPDKRKFFDEYVFPLKNTYNLKLYGQDWSRADRVLGWVQRGGQYFNIPYLRSIRKPKLSLIDEARIYSSSIISINVHEKYQREYGGDCNERVFKIPFCKGFQIVDGVSCIRKYFNTDSEMVVAASPEDWLEKIHYYMKYQEEREAIVKAGHDRVVRDHTYHHRVKQIEDLTKITGKTDGKCSY